MYTRSLLLAAALSLSPACGQTLRPPYLERFEGVTVPMLPAGWGTSTNRSAGGDFTTTTSAVYAESTAVLSTNATIEQWLATPDLDFTGLAAESLAFYERRSGTHNAGLLIEASIDGGDTFDLRLGDTLRNPGTTAYVRRALKLPDGLNGRPAVRIRFRVAGNGTGATGTLRVDNVFVGARAELDAAVGGIETLPAIPNAGDSLTVSVTVFNGGLRPLWPVSVGFFADRDSSGTIEPGELFASGALPDTLPPRASAVLAARLGGLIPGRLLLAAVASAPGDQIAKNDTLVLVLAVGRPRGAVVINELMYAPPAGEPEWMELLNMTGGDVFLQGWSVSNRTTSSAYTVTGESQLLRSARFAVLTKDTALFLRAHPASGNAVIALPDLPTFLFNNAGDAAVLFDDAGAVIDTMHYLPSWGGQDGRSLERIEPAGTSLDPSNWGSSDDSSGSTPGRQNSLTPLDSNLQLRRLGAVRGTDGSEELIAVVRNSGRTPAAGFSVGFFRDADGNGVADVPIAEAPSSATLAPGDSCAVSAVWPSAPPGLQHIVASLAYAADMRPSDNAAAGTVEIPYPRSSLVINEIMFDPLAGESEYVELYNRSGDPVDLRRWQLTDGRGRGSRRLTDSLHTVPPGGYVVVAGDSVIFRQFAGLEPAEVIIPSSPQALNNSGDDVVLIDLAGTAIDSLRYLPDWHNPMIDDPSGRSLERINAELASTDRRNWSTCANPSGGTPGKRNSLQTSAPGGDASLAISPNPFSPDGDGRDDVAIIAYRLTGPAALVRIRIFDSAGRPVRLLEDGNPAGSRGEVVWDGMTDRHGKAPIGLYIVLLEAAGAGGDELQKLKGVVVVAGVL